MTKFINLSHVHVHALAKAAGLPLSDERAKLLAPKISEWTTAAVKLNIKMSLPQYQETTPVTSFATIVNIEKEE